MPHDYIYTLLSYSLPVAKYIIWLSKVGLDRYNSDLTSMSGSDHDNREPSFVDS